MIHWSPKQLALVLPNRRNAPPPEPFRSFDAIWQRLSRPSCYEDFRRGLPRTAESLRPFVLELLERLENTEIPTRPASPQAEAILWEITTHEHHDGIADHWVRTGGLAHGVRSACAIESITSDLEFSVRKDGGYDGEVFFLPRTRWNDWHPQGNSSPWNRLRAHLAAGDRDAWEEAREVAEEIWPSVSLETRLGLAYIFPENPQWSHRLMREELSLEGRLVLAQTVDDPDVFFEGFSQAKPLLKEIHLGTLETMPGILVNILDSVGPEAITVFDTWIASKEIQAKHRKTIADTFAHIDHPTALDLLFLNAHEKSVTTAANAAIRRFPQSALQRLAVQLKKGGLSRVKKKAIRTLVLKMEKKKDFAELLDALEDSELHAVRKLTGDAPAEPRKARKSASKEAPPPREAALEDLPEALRTSDEHALKKLRRRAFWQPRIFHRPRVAGGPAWPLEAVDALGILLMEQRRDEIRAAREGAEAADLSALARDLFEAWLGASAPSAEKWAFLALADLGDDDDAQRLDPLLRAWADAGQHPRAKLGLEVLQRFDSDVALRKLDGFTRGTRHGGLRAKAGKLMRQAASERGLSYRDLIDGLERRLYVEVAGSMTLDYGPRQFRVGFDEQLKPFVRDADGSRLRAIPRPRKSDDAAAAKRAGEIWKSLQKEVKQVAKREISRFERMMYAADRHDPAKLREDFLGHPLIAHLVHRLIWGTYSAKGKLLDVFRVAEDGTFADANDETWELPADARVGLPHPVELAADLRDRLAETLTDYEILQPFAQVQREVFTPSAEEKRAVSLALPPGLQVRPRRIYSMLARGWNRGEPQEYGFTQWIERPSLRRNGFVVVPLTPGLAPGRGNDEDQALGAAVFVRDPGTGQESELPFGKLDAITFSELKRDLERLRAESR